MTDTNVDDVTIKKTQDILGKYVKKPNLSEKLLRKPPFRFLYDVFNAVIKETGYYEGLYTPEELNIENIKDRDGKLQFLQKMIDTIKIAANEPLKVRASKIVAGQEPDKTNELLQLIGEVINKKLDWKSAVETVNNNFKVSPTKSTHKSSKVNEKDDKKSRNKDKEKTNSKIKEKDTKNILTEISPNRKGEKLKTSPPAVNEKAKKYSKHSREGARNDLKIEDLKSQRRAKDPSQNNELNSDSAKLNRKSKDIPETRHNRQNASKESNNDGIKSNRKSKNLLAEKDPLKSSKNVEKNIVDQIVTPDTIRKSLENTDSQPTTIQSPSTKSELSTASIPVKAEEAIRQEIEEVKTFEGGIQSVQNEKSLKLAPSVPTTSIEASETNVIIAKSVESDRSSTKARRSSGSKLQRNDNANESKNNLPVTQITSNISEESYTSQFLPNQQKKEEHIYVKADSDTPPRPKTSLRPPSARPASARPGAPRRRDKNIEIVLHPNDPIKMGGVSVKLESLNTDLEDDGENLVIIEDHNDEESSNLKLGSDNIIESNVTQQGHLVQQILETQKELVYSTNEMEKEKKEVEALSTLNSRQSSGHHMDNIRDVIQNITKSISPFGKLLDFIPEDIDAMQLEWTMWRDSYTSAVLELKKQKSLTESATEPMKNQLVQLDINIKEYQDIIDASRTKILQNSERILRLLTEQ